MRSLSDVLEAHDAETLEDLADHLIARLDIEDRVWSQWDDEVLVVGNNDIGYVPLDLQLPQTVRGLERLSTDFVERITCRSLAGQLPSWQEATSPAQTTFALAQFFGVDPATYVEALGGGWYPVNGERCVGHGHVPIRWFAAGEPPQILLGVGEEYATLARPDFYPGGLGGPPSLESADMVDVELRGPYSLVILSDELPALLKKGRRGMGWCRGCLRYVDVSRPSGQRHRYCRECLGTYLGLIID